MYATAIPAFARCENLKAVSDWGVSHTNITRMSLVEAGETKPQLVFS
jgi:hypothetical protein